MKKSLSALLLLLVLVIGLGAGYAAGMHYALGPQVELVGVFKNNTTSMQNPDRQLPWLEGACVDDRLPLKLRQEDLNRGGEVFDARVVVTGHLAISEGIPGDPLTGMEVTSLKVAK